MIFELELDEFCIQSIISCQIIIETFLSIYRILGIDQEVYAFCGFRSNAAENYRIFSRFRITLSRDRNRKRSDIET